MTSRPDLVAAARRAQSAANRNRAGADRRRRAGDLATARTLDGLADACVEQVDQYRRQLTEEARP